LKPTKMKKPGWQEIVEAHERIKPFIHRTPVLTCQTIDGIAGAELFFKCENFQKVGAFKIRGATNAIQSLPHDQLQRGVATHSSGNHAQAMALGAKLAGVDAHIVMPSSAPEIKKKAVLGYGAHVYECEPTLEARESTLEEVVKKTGATFIHPYDDLRVIAGQASCAKELLEDYPDLDQIVCPVGGGGLMSGTLLTVQELSTSVDVLGAEPEGADDAYRSLQSGSLVPSVEPDTIADGLLTSLGSLTYPIIKEYIREIITMDDKAIVAAMRLIWERMKIIVEPSCAVTLAAVLKEPEKFAGQKVGLIITGGNVDLNKLPF